MIHACFGLYDKTGSYSKFTGTAMLSLFENIATPPSIPSITVHILHDNTLTDDNRDKFIQIAERYGQRLKFYNVEEIEICREEFAEVVANFPQAKESRFSIAMFYRLFIPTLLLPQGIEKSFYLDSDIIVNLDISEFWQIDLGDKPFGAVSRASQIKDKKNDNTRKAITLVREGIVNAEDYFFSGGLLMNLKVMREKKNVILAGMKFISERSQCIYLDQDVLNYCFSTSYLKLPTKFNTVMFFERFENEWTIEKKIYHYAGGIASGLGLDMSDPYNHLWWSYFIKTPWFNIDTINNISKAIQRFNIERENFMLRFSAIPSGMSRAFIVDEEHADLIEKKFSVRDDEDVIIIDPKSKDSLQKLKNLMRVSKNRNIFFVGIADVAWRLKEADFVEGENFFDVSQIYSPTWASNVNGYNLIMSM